MKQSSGTEIPIVASNLDLFSTDGDLCALCDHAIENKLQGILIFPSSVSLCSDLLFKSDVQLGCAISFPDGRSTLATKLFEIKEVKKLGAQAVTVFCNYSALRSGEKNLINEEIEKISKLAKELKLKLTIAVEASILKQKQLKYVVKLCKEYEVDSFLTSYGSSFSECCSHLNDISDKLKSEITVVSYLEKLNRKDVEKLSNLGTSTILTSNRLKCLK